MTINSRTKGKNGELELAEMLRSFGHTARRGVQFKGGVDSPDVVCDTLPGYHFECKRVESGNLYKWMDQAIRDAGADKIPVVVHRKSKKQWVAIVNFEDFMMLVGAHGDIRGHEAMASEEPATVELDKPRALRSQSAKATGKSEDVSCRKAK